ncbi:hypothetical protein L3Q82_012107 [Scortum barcoo]|uniref:Uncharacterized protein n=1 Tax=Scortum barcoo TaxID=214431 RepID=A0ACB8W668_9TELE|nr:hypothetical protein L3Q82_012107 [Scortum barcoo]
MKSAVRPSVGRRRKQTDEVDWFDEPLAPAGLGILHPFIMRSLLDSSWMKFGPAGRDSLDWSPGPSALPSTDRQATGQSSGEAIISVGTTTYIAIATVSILLLLVFSALGFMMWRRRRGFNLSGKLGLANVIALEDLQDPERNCELLSSIRRSRREHQIPSSSSEQDVTDVTACFSWSTCPRRTNRRSPGSPELPAQAAPRTWSCCRRVLGRRQAAETKKRWRG